MALQPNPFLEAIVESLQTSYLKGIPPQLINRNQYDKQYWIPIITPLWINVQNLNKNAQVFDPQSITPEMVNLGQKYPILQKYLDLVKLTQEIELNSQPPVSQSNHLPCQDVQLPKKEDRDQNKSPLQNNSNQIQINPQLDENSFVKIDSLNQIQPLFEQIGFQQLIDKQKQEIFNFPPRVQQFINQFIPEQIFSNNQSTHIANPFLLIQIINTHFKLIDQERKILETLICTILSKSKVTYTKLVDQPYFQTVLLLINACYQIMITINPFLSQLYRRKLSLCQAFIIGQDSTTISQDLDHQLRDLYQNIQSCKKNCLLYVEVDNPVDLLKTLPLPNSVIQPQQLELPQSFEYTIDAIIFQGQFTQEQFNHLIYLSNYYNVSLFLVDEFCYSKLTLLKFNYIVVSLKDTILHYQLVKNKHSTKFQLPSQLQFIDDNQLSFSQKKVKFQQFIAETDSLTANIIQHLYNLDVLFFKDPDKLNLIYNQSKEKAIKKFISQQNQRQQDNDPYPISKLRKELIDQDIQPSLIIAQQQIQVNWVNIFNRPEQLSVLKPPQLVYLHCNNLMSQTQISFHQNSLCLESDTSNSLSKYHQHQSSSNLIDHQDEFKYQSCSNQNHQNFELLIKNLNFTSLNTNSPQVVLSPLTSFFLQSKHSYLNLIFSKINTVCHQRQDPPLKSNQFILRQDFYQIDKIKLWNRFVLLVQEIQDSKKKTQIQIYFMKALLGYKYQELIKQYPQFPTGTLPYLINILWTGNIEEIDQYYFKEFFT